MYGGERREQKYWMEVKLVVNDTFTLIGLNLLHLERN